VSLAIVLDRNKLQDTITRFISFVSLDCSACSVRGESCHKTKGDFHCLPNKGLTICKEIICLKLTEIILALNSLRIHRLEISFLSLMDHHQGWNESIVIPLV
jgi:hypothetical protein